MNKLFLLGGVGTLLLGMAACSNDIDEPAINTDGNVHFKVQLPSYMRTRAPFADGKTASTLTYAVYDKESGETVILSEDEVTFDPATLTAQVDLRLVNGKNYDLVFWADSPGNDFYTFDSTARTVTVNYDGVKSNAEDRDAFFASRSISVSGPVNETIELYRPFAQVNLGTDDMKTDAVTSAYKAGLGVALTTTAYNTLNLSTGEVSGTPVPVTFASAPASDCTDLFPYNPDPAQANPYTYISMDYILVPADSEVIDCDYTFYNGTVANPQTLNVSNVPVQRNYRTNIYGSLLTSPANLQIVIRPAFEEPDYNVKVHNVATPDQLLAAISTAKDGDEIHFNGDMSVAQSGIINIDKDLTFVVPAGVTVNTERQVNTANFVVEKGASLTITGGGTMNGTSRIVDVYGDATVENVNFNTSTKNRGAALTVYDGGGLTLESGTVTAANCGVWVEGDFTMNGGTVKSLNSSADPEVGSGFSYAVRAITGSANIVINGGEVEGIQGAVGMYAGNITINGGYFHTHPKFSTADNFYALYVADSSGHAVVNGGYFYAEGKPDVYYVDNHGSLELKGGFYEDQGKQVTGNDNEPTVDHGICQPYAGYEWKAVSDGIYKWEIVPVSASK